jgi:tetratricopeptide (TPR) repeat protein
VDDPIADRYLDEGKLDEAIFLHKKLLEKKPSAGITHYHLGFAYGLKGLYDEEIAEYQKAIKLGHKEEGLFYNLGMAYIDLETDYEYAVEAFNKVIQLNPKHADAYFNLGLSYQNLGNYRKATESLLKAIQLNPAHLEAYNVLGVIYALSGQPHKAREAWMEILKQDPSNRPALINLETLNKTRPGPNATPRSQKMVESSTKISTK